eukprot:1257641-Amphidinium_carterae.1
MAGKRTLHAVYGHSPPRAPVRPGLCSRHGHRQPTVPCLPRGWPFLLAHGRHADPCAALARRGHAPTPRPHLVSLGQGSPLGPTKTSLQAKGTLC